MQALDEVRTAEIEMDMELSPVEECYAFLQRCGVAVPREEIERVDSLRYTFKNLQAQACTVQSHLVSIQLDFKKDLLESVQIYKQDLEAFLGHYNQVGCAILFVSSVLAMFIYTGWAHGNWITPTRSQ